MKLICLNISIFLMLVINSSICFSQEIIGTNNGLEYNINHNNLEDYNIVRTDQNGVVVSTLTPSSLSQPFDLDQENYMVFGLTNIENGKITSNPSDYDYWLIQKEQEIKFSIFPNPSLGIINLSTSFIDSRTQFKIYDELNRVVYENEINEINTIINLNNYSKGIYFVKIFNNEKILKIEKICLN